MLPPLPSTWRFPHLTRHVSTQDSADIMITRSPSPIRRQSSHQHKHACTSSGRGDDLGTSLLDAHRIHGKEEDYTSCLLPWRDSGAHSMWPDLLNLVPLQPSALYPQCCRFSCSQPHRHSHFKQTISLHSHNPAMVPDHHPLCHDVLVALQYNAATLWSYIHVSLGEFPTTLLIP